MTSTINKTDGSVLTIIADGTVDNTTNLVLIGKNYAGYGDFLNENFIHLLENAASAVAPSSPLVGQLWWDKSQSTLKVWTGSIFKVISSSTSQDTAPTTPVIGDLWWDTFNNQLNVYNGSSWTLIGPAFTSTIGTSGTIVDTIDDDNGDSHIAIKIFIEETLVAVISKDAYEVNTDTEADIYNAFRSIRTGFNLAREDEISGIVFNGTATDATTLAKVDATNYARTDIAYGPETFYNHVTVSNNSGIAIGTTGSFTQTISGSTVVLKNSMSVPANGSSIVLFANISGIETDALTVGANAAGGAEVRLSVSPNVANNSSSSGLAIATVENVRTQTGNALVQDGSRTVKGHLMPDVSTTWNFGNNAVRFGIFYGNATVTNSVTAATIGNTGTVITGSTVNAASIGNIGAAITGNSLVVNNASISGNLTVTDAWVVTPFAKVTSAMYAENYYFSNGASFIPGVASLNGKKGEMTIVGDRGISHTLSNNTVTLTPANGFNGYGVRTVSTSTPSGGSDGDIWYQV